MCMRNRRRKLQKFLLFIATLPVVHPLLAQAMIPQAYSEDRIDLTARDHLFSLVTGGLGKFMIILTGLGGLASLLITRQGRKGKNAPVLGIAMLLIAAAIFTLQVLIKSGMMGHQYLEW